MLKLIVEGNLGADAEVKTENGSKFVSMSIAHTRRRTSEDGHVTESTQWISATWNGDGGNLLPYLKKGARVFVIGDGDVRTYHSEAQRRLVAGINVFIRQIELTGGMPEAVPRDLYDTDGVAHRVSKYYNVADVRSCVLYNRSREQYTVDANGWVLPTNVQATTDATAVDNSTEQAVEPSETAQDTTTRKQQKK